MAPVAAFMMADSRFLSWPPEIFFMMIGLSSSTAWSGSNEPRMSKGEGVGLLAGGRAEAEGNLEAKSLDCEHHAELLLQCLQA